MTTDGIKSYGVDVAVARADDLDKQMISDVTSLDNPSVLDLGCGQGGQSVRLVQAGATVVGIDIEDYAADFERLRRQFHIQEFALTYIQGDGMEYVVLTQDSLFDVCCMQRMIHYVPYDYALRLLTQLKHTVRGKLYVSVTGIESEIGAAYPDKHKAVSARFCSLTAEAAETFSITEPVCLYSQSEFESLLIAAGWSINKIWTSAFGNHKAICS